MKEDYRWNYNIKIKTKDGEFEYEKETLENLELLLQKHPNYESVEAVHKEAQKVYKRGTKK